MRKSVVSRPLCGRRACGVSKRVKGEGQERARLSSVCARNVLPLLVALRPKPSAVQCPRSSSAPTVRAQASAPSASTATQRCALCILSRLRAAAQAATVGTLTPPCGRAAGQQLREEALALALRCLHLQEGPSTLQRRAHLADA